MVVVGAAMGKESSGLLFPRASGRGRLPETDVAGAGDLSSEVGGEPRSAPFSSSHLASCEAPPSSMLSQMGLTENVREKAGGVKGGSSKVYCALPASSVGLAGGPRGVEAGARGANRGE